MNYRIGDTNVPAEMIDPEYRKASSIQRAKKAISQIYHNLRYTITGQDEQTIRGTPTELSRKLSIKLGY